MVKNTKFKSLIELFKSDDYLSGEDRYNLLDAVIKELDDNLFHVVSRIDKEDLIRYYLFEFIDLSKRWELFEPFLSGQFLESQNSRKIYYKNPGGFWGELDFDWMRIFSHFNVFNDFLSILQLRCYKYEINFFDLCEKFGVYLKSIQYHSSMIVKTERWKEISKKFDGIILSIWSILDNSEKESINILGVPIDEFMVSQSFKRYSDFDQIIKRYAPDGDQINPRGMISRPRIFFSNDEYVYFNYLVEQMGKSNAVLSFLYRKLHDYEITPNPKIVCSQVDYINFCQSEFGVVLTKIKVLETVETPDRLSQYNSFKNAFNTSLLN
jgi:hypothetical protein